MSNTSGAIPPDRRTADIRCAAVLAVIMIEYGCGSDYSYTERRMSALQCDVFDPCFAKIGIYVYQLLYVFHVVSIAPLFCYYSIAIFFCASIGILTYSSIVSLLYSSVEVN